MVSSSTVDRLFLQSMLSRRVVTDKFARVLWDKCVEAVRVADENAVNNYDPTKFDEFMHGLNDHLGPVDLKLTVTVDEVAGKKIWAMVNTKGDELAQVATDYTAVEIAYFKAVVEQIVLAPSESYSISTLAALREVNGLKPTMTKSQAEVVLNSFVAKGWLSFSNRNRYSLSSRAMMELQGYLKSNYEDDIHECTSCYEFVTTGVGCYVPACAARLHNHCYKRFSRDHDTCPTCRSGWSDPNRLVKIGEAAIGDGVEGRRRTKKKDDDDEENEEESENEDEDEPEPKPTKKRGRGKAAKAAKGKKKQAQEDDEDSEEDEMEVDEESPAPAESQNRRKKR